jgi:hypothetical protein
LEETALKTRQTPDGIAQSIGKALQAAGYETDLSVGRSEYRIDVAIIDPQKPDQYMLCILLDGEGYGSAKTTRDREIAQEGVLTGLGWQLLRIWTMDWWDNAEKEMERIFQKLRDIEAGKTEEPEAPTPTAPEAKEPLLSIPRQAPVYQATQLPEKLLTAEEFVDHRRIPTITRAVEQVIAQEAPISLSLLTMLILDAVFKRFMRLRFLIAAFVVSLFVLFYVLMLPVGKLWQIFLIAVPAVAIVYLSFKIRIRPDKKAKSADSTNNRE